MNGLTFGPFELACAAGLVVVNAVISALMDLDIHRSIVVSTLRMVVQLLLVGFALRFIFGSDNHWIGLVLIVLMVIAASYEVGARQRTKLSGPWHYAISGIAVSGATILVSAFALLTVADTEDWTAPRIVIPIFGIVLGTAMNATSIALNSIFDSVSSQRSAIEAQLALGRTRRQAMGPVIRRAIHAGTIPVFNQMAGAGVITLPGIMSGQILAGTDPLIAAQSQIYLMCLLCSSSIGSVIVGVWLASRRLSDERERLRLDRLRLSRR